MPAIKRFRVTQTREIVVTSTDIIDAINIASEAFSLGTDFDPTNIGAVSGDIKVVDVSATEDY